jgi:hypothetical protein
VAVGIGDGSAEASAASAGNVQRIFGLLSRSKAGGLSDETQSEFGLCSMAVPVVVHSEAQRAFVVEALGEKKVTPPPTVAVGAQATRPG